MILLCVCVLVFWLVGGSVLALAAAQLTWAAADRREARRGR